MAKRIKIENVTYKTTLDKLNLLLDKIKDLTKLSDTACIKINNNNVLVYSFVGGNGHIHAFKSHVLNIEDVFDTKNDLETDLKCIIEGSKRLYNSINLFIKYMKTKNIDEKIEFKLYYNEDFVCEKLVIKNSKSKEEINCGDPTAIQGADLDTETIEEAMDTDNSDFYFELDEEDYKYIKSKTTLEKESDALYLNINDKKLSLGETKWEHNICDVEEDDMTITFPKKYFKCINYEDEKLMKIYVFDTFLLILGEKTNLMITIELSV